MKETFYGVLGVDPSTDEATIVRAYREKVKTHHPDVSDAPDANAKFKRLTTAKDVLTDCTERARYDRLGHDTYVRQHVDCTEWAATVSDSPRGTGGATASASGNGATTTSKTARRTATTHAAGSDQPSSHQHNYTADYGTATAYYRPGERVGVTRGDTVGRTVGAIREVAPWLVVHLVLLISAGAMAAVLLAGTTAAGGPSVTSIMVAAMMISITVLVIALHISASLHR